MGKQFQFKQFAIAQNKTAMKIGTDGVLLGAWATHQNPKQILDIGTGTGVIALMMAQRFPSANITAIDIEEGAYLQAKENFEQSQWKDRLTSVHTSFQDFSPNKKFDLIVSNPPFFNQSFLPSEENRTTARHTTQLSFRKLFQQTSKLLNPEGIAAFIFPYEDSLALFQLAKSYKIHPKKWCKVKGNQNAAYKRSLVSFQHIDYGLEHHLQRKNLIIEKERHIYTDEYTELVKDFYLKV